MALTNGDVITLTDYDSIITITNKDTVNVANNVTVTFVFPAAITVNADIPSQGTYSALVWTVGALNPSASATIDFDFNVIDSSAFEGTGVTFTYTAALSPQVDPDPSNDTGSRTMVDVSCESVAGCTNTRFTVREVSAASSPVLSSDDIILVDASSNVVDIPITPANFWDAGTTSSKELTIKAKDITNSITVTTSSGVIQDDDTIGASLAVFTFANVGESITLFTDGTNFYLK